MKILAIETSGSNCSVALLDEQSVIANFNLNIGMTHSEILLPMIDKLFTISKLTINDVDAFACSVGPGSFTGIRIGISTVKGFALSLNKPVISVSTLEGLAYNVPHFDGMICSILDAKNNNVYACLYRLNDKVEQISAYQTDSISSLIEEIKKYNEKVIFVGDGAISYYKILKNELKKFAYFMPYHLNEQSAVSIAKAAFHKYNEGQIDNADTLSPLYLKKSQAERMLDENATDSNN